MALPRWWARANRVGTNRLMRHIAWWMPGYGLIEHTGRRSGRSYETPVFVFARPGGYTVALAYGTRADWVRNVQATGKATLRTRRRLVPVTDPEITRQRRHPDLPWLFRQAFGAGAVHDFLELTTATDRSDREEDMAR
jgi:deazaflavin-dependent oxidoreductase (nitroreductase family)